MRVAFAGDWFLPRLGGIEHQMRDLALRLMERGHEVEVITPVPGPDLVDGIPVHRLGVERLPGAGIVFTPAAFRRLRELLAGGRYDVVHVHFGIIAPAAYGATAIAESLGIPTVATFHSVLTHFEVPQWLLSGVMQMSEWRTQWTAVSSVVAESVGPLTGGSNVRILPNGIDPAWWRPTADAWAVAPSARATGNGTLRAVSVMRLHRRKRPGALVRAVAEALDRLPRDRRLTLEVIGDGPELGRLHRQIERARLEQVVTLVGWREREEVRDRLHRSDLFLLPSRLEAFGIAALEARCAGLPVVAMQRAGVRDFLAPGRDAVLVDSDAAFADAIVRLASAPDALRAMRDVAYAPPAGVAWPEVVAAHEAVYAAARG